MTSASCTARVVTEKVVSRRVRQLSDRKDAFCARYFMTFQWMRCPDKLCLISAVRSCLRPWLQSVGGSAEYYESLRSVVYAPHSGVFAKRSVMAYH